MTRRLKKSLGWFLRDREAKLQPPELAAVAAAADFQRQVERLHRLTVYSRWTVVGLCWVIVGPISFWGLRREIGLWMAHFTWAAVRYGLFFNRLPALGLFFCTGLTTAVLLWQSRNILWGLPELERRRLEQQVWQIRQQGRSHPLWNWVCRASDALDVQPGQPED